MADVFTWSSQSGCELCRGIVNEFCIGYDPHNYQVEGVCASLDRKDLLAITPTGSGKTGFYTMYILVILAVIADPTLCPTAKFPKNPCLTVICPTIPLQLDMVCAIGSPFNETDLDSRPPK